MCRGQRVLELEFPRHSHQQRYVSIILFRSYSEFGESIRSHVSGSVAIIVGLMFLSGWQSLVAAQVTAAQESSYDLRIHVLPERHSMEVHGTWKLPVAVQDRQTIEFFLSPKMKDLSLSVVAPPGHDSHNSLTSKEAGGDTKWTLSLKSPIPAGQAATFEFSYVSDGTPAPQLNISPEGSFAGSGGELWYPQTSFSSREIGNLRFEVPPGETVVSNGKLLSNTGQEASGRFTFRVSNPVKFAFAAGKYNILRGGSGPVYFALYLLHPSPQAQRIAGGCSKIVTALAAEFGDLPQRQISLVEVDFRSRVLGAGEYGFILADTSQFDSEFDPVYWAHELGHQWWGDLVRSMSNTPGAELLTEGMAQFGALEDHRIDRRAGSGRTATPHGISRESPGFGR